MRLYVFREALPPARHCGVTLYWLQLRKPELPQTLIANCGEFLHSILGVGRLESLRSFPFNETLIGARLCAGLAIAPVVEGRHRARSSGWKTRGVDWRGVRVRRRRRRYFLRLLILRASRIAIGRFAIRAGAFIDRGEAVGGLSEETDCSQQLSGAGLSAPHCGEFRFLSERHFSHPCAR